MKDEIKVGDIAKPIPENFNHVKILKHIRVRDDGCWESALKAKTHAGYSRVSVKNSTFMFHRITYHIFNGRINKGMQIDHICQKRFCINPDHLRQVTPLQNAHSSNTSAHLFSVRTHCKNGHEYKDGSFYTYYKNARICKICLRIGSLKSWRKKRDAKKELIVKDGSLYVVDEVGK